LHHHLKYTEGKLYWFSVNWNFPCFELE